MSTRFEYFPNELFLHIFTYFDISNLYYSFWNINQRFNNLIHSLKNLSLIINNNNLFLIEIFAHQIVQLKVDTSQTIDFRQFFNLHSLELCRASQLQIEQIRSNIMPNLIRLTISTPFHISLPLELIQEIFSNNFRFLHYAQISRLDMFEKLSTFQSFSLHTLRITCTNPNVILRVLQKCPNLFCYHITYFGQNHYILLPLTYSNHSLNSFFKVSLNASVIFLGGNSAFSICLKLIPCSANRVSSHNTYRFESKVFGPPRFFKFFIMCSSVTECF